MESERPCGTVLSLKLLLTKGTEEVAQAAIKLKTQSEEDWKQSWTFQSLRTQGILQCLCIKSEKENTALEEWSKIVASAKETSHFTLCGEAGAGKTAALMFMEACQWNRYPETNVLPLRILNWRNNTDDSSDERIFEHFLNEIGISREILRAVRIFFLFDGFSEPAQVQQLLEDIAGLSYVAVWACDASDESVLCSTLSTNGQFRCSLHPPIDSPDGLTGLKFMMASLLGGLGQKDNKDWKKEPLSGMVDAYFSECCKRGASSSHKAKDLDNIAMKLASSCLRKKASFVEMQDVTDIPIDSMTGILEKHRNNLCFVHRCFIPFLVARLLFSHENNQERVRELVLQMPCIHLNQHVLDFITEQSTERLSITLFQVVNDANIDDFTQCIIAGHAGCLLCNCSDVNNPAWIHRLVAVAEKLAEQDPDEALGLFELLKEKSESLAVGDQSWFRTRLGLAYCLTYSKQHDLWESIEHSIVLFQEVAFSCSQSANPSVWATARTYLADAYCKRIKGDKQRNIEEAIRHYRAALAARSRDTAPFEWASLQMGLANAYDLLVDKKREDNLVEAVSHLRQALEVWQLDDFPKEWSNASMNLALLYLAQDKVTEAIGVLKLVSEFTRERFPDTYLDCQTNLATALRKSTSGSRTKNLDMALAIYKEVARAPKLTAQRRATVKMNIGVLLQDRCRDPSDLEEAIASLCDALKVWTRDAFPDSWAQVNLNLANVMHKRVFGERKENIECAIRHCYDALQVFSPNSSPGLWSTTSHNLCVCFNDRLQGSRQENLDSVIRVANKVMLHNKDHDHHTWAVSALTCANALLELGKEQTRAEYLMMKCLSVWAETKGDDYATVCQSLARFFAGQKRVSEAKEKFQEAVENRSKSRNPVQWARTVHDFGSFLLAIGKPNDAADQCLEALDVLQSHIFPNEHIACAETLCKAYVHLERGDKAYQLAHDSLLLLLEQLGRVVEGTNDFGAKSAIASQMRGFVACLSSPLLSNKNKADAVRLLEWLRSLGYQDLLARDFRTDGSHDLAGAYWSRVFNVQVREAERVRGSGHEVFQRLHKPNSSLPSKFSPGNWESINLSVDADLVLVWFVSDVWSGVYVMANHIVEQVCFDPGADKILRHLASVLVFQPLVAEQVIHAFSKAMCMDRVLKVIKDILPVTSNHCRVYSVAHGPICAVPVDELPIFKGNDVTTFREAIGKDTAFGYLPNLAIVRHIKKSSSFGQPTLVAASPTSTLKGADNEIMALFPEMPSEDVKRLFGTNASKAKVIDAIREAASSDRGFIWHVASHGHYDSARRWNAGLEMHKEKLQVHELLELPLQKCVLTTLSTCVSGLNDSLAGLGEDGIGLSAGLFVAGCKNVVSSFWAVSDLATEVLMEYFYLHLQEGLTICDALQKAKERMREATYDDINGVLRKHGTTPLSPLTEMLESKGVAWVAMTPNRPFQELIKLKVKVRDLKPLGKDGSQREQLLASVQHACQAECCWEVAIQEEGQDKQTPYIACYLTVEAPKFDVCVLIPRGHLRLPLLPEQAEFVQLVGVPKQASNSQLKIAKHFGQIRVPVHEADLVAHFLKLASDCCQVAYPLDAPGLFDPVTPKPGTKIFHNAFFRSAFAVHGEAHISIFPSSASSSASKQSVEPSSELSKSNSKTENTAEADKSSSEPEKISEIEKTSETDEPSSVADKPSSEGEKMTNQGETGLPAQAEAVFVSDASWPDGSEVVCDSPFVKKWVMKNSGSIAWPSTTQLVDFNTNKAELQVVGAVASHEEVTVEARLVAPKVPGEFSRTFRLRTGDGGEFFGDFLWLALVATKSTAMQTFRSTSAMRTRGAEASLSPVMRMRSHAPATRTRGLDPSVPVEVLGGPKDTSTRAAGGGVGVPADMQPEAAMPSALFLADINLPDGTAVACGSHLTKRWLLRNDGPSDWPQDTMILLETEYNTTPAGAIGHVSAGSDVEVAVDVIVPMAPGVFSQRYRLAANGYAFGVFLWFTFYVY